MTKRHIKSVVLAVLATVVMMSCSTGVKWNDIEFYDVEKLDNLTEKPVPSEDNEFAALEETADRNIDVKVDMQFMKSDKDENENVCRLINATLMEVVLKQSSELSIDEAVERYIAEKKADFQEEDVTTDLYDHLTGRAEYGMRNIITYRLTEDTYTGGAHPFCVTTIFTFDAMTGEYLSLEQVFPSSTHEALTELLTQKLIKNLGKETLEEIQEDGYLEMMEMFVSNNFALRTDSVEFYYNPYDIAPYACGPSSICLSYESVKPYISARFER